MFKEISQIKDFVSSKQQYLSKPEFENLNKLLSKIQMNEDIYFKNLKNKADLEYRKRHFLAAINLYTEYLSKRESYIIYSNRSACYHKLNMFDEAIQDCLSGLKINKLFFRFYLRLGVIYKIIDDNEKAKEFLRAGIELNEHLGVFEEQLKKLEECPEIILKK